MGHLSRDHQLVQNPALGALLQWRFATGYTDVRNDAPGVPVALVFLVLPVLLHEPTRSLLTATQRRSGLRGFAAKFASSRIQQSDILLALHGRVDQTRELSLQSLRMAMAYRLVTLDKSSGTVIALSRAEPRAYISTSVRPLTRNAEKLGDWFSRLTPFEIASILKVRF